MEWWGGCMYGWVGGWHLDGYVSLLNISCFKHICRKRQNAD